VRSIIIATVFVVLISIISFQAMPVSWELIASAIGGDVWSAKAMVVVWMLAPLCITLVSWIELSWRDNEGKRR